MSICKAGQAKRRDFQQNFHKTIGECLANVRFISVRPRSWITSSQIHLRTEWGNLSLLTGSVWLRPNRWLYKFYNFLMTPTKICVIYIVLDASLDSFFIRSAKDEPIRPTKYLWVSRYYEYSPKINCFVLETLRLNYKNRLDFSRELV